MQPAPPPPPAPKPPAPASRSPRRFILTVFLVAAAFAAGFIPPTLKARRAAEELTTTRLDLQLSNLHRLLGVASHEAQRNNYASAADAARTFFDGCANIANNEAFADEPRTRIALSTYAASRDAVMTQLAMADPQARERLASLYLTMNGVLQRRE